MFKTYLKDLSRLIFRPILFYTRMPEGDWSDKPVTFAGITGLILSLVITLVIFITQYFPIGTTLLVKVQPAKYILVAPVMLVLAFMFFVITFTLAFGVILALILGMFFLLATLLFAAANFLSGKGDYYKDIKALFFASGIAVLFCLPPLLVILVKWGILSFSAFVVGYNMIYFFAVLYFYGLSAIIARKTHNLSKGKAFAAALLPALFLILIGLFADKVIIPKVQPWIT